MVGKPKDTKWSIALYIRLSKEDGNEVSYSVINQEKILKSYIEKTDENVELFNVYIDDGRTGTDTNREAFQEMLRDIEDKKVNCVIVKDLSRLSRNYAEAGIYLEQYFVEKSVRFISLELPCLDSYKKPDEITSIATAFQNIVNDDFCRQTSLKIRGTFNRKRADGEFIGAFAPYGYKKALEDKNRLVIDETVAPVIRDIFNWFLEGNTKIGITKKLNDLGVPSPLVYKKEQGFNYKNPNSDSDLLLWSARTVAVILKNQMYIGNMVQGRYKVMSYKVHKQISVPKDEWFIVKDTHEPIVDKNTFNKVQKLLKRDIKTPDNQRKTYLFSGYLRCADCKRAMHRFTTGKYVYYSCSTYKFQSKNVCTKHSIREDELQNAILYAINEQITLIEDFEKIVKDVENAETTKNAVKRIAESIITKEKEMTTINNIRDGLYNDWKSEVISKEDYFRLREKHDKKLDLIKQALEALRDELTFIQNTNTSDLPLFAYFKKYNSLNNLDRAVLIELVENIHIHENKQIDIEFCFNDQLKYIMSLIK